MKAQSAEATGGIQRHYDRSKDELLRTDEKPQVRLVANIGGSLVNRRRLPMNVIHRLLRYIPDYELVPAVRTCTANEKHKSNGERLYELPPVKASGNDDNRSYSDRSSFTCFRHLHIHKMHLISPEGRT